MRSKLFLVLCFCVSFFQLDGAMRLAEPAAEEAAQRSVADILEGIRPEDRAKKLYRLLEGAIRRVSFDGVFECLQASKTVSDFDINFRNVQGKSFLHMVFEGENKDPYDQRKIASLLVESGGIDVDLVDNEGYTVLARICAMGEFFLADTFLSNFNPNPNIPEPTEKNSPLHLVVDYVARERPGASSDLERLTDAFLEKGFDVNARNAAGETVLDKVFDLVTKNKRFASLMEKLLSASQKKQRFLNMVVLFDERHDDVNGAMRSHLVDALKVIDKCCIVVADNVVQDYLRQDYLSDVLRGGVADSTLKVYKHHETVGSLFFILSNEYRKRCILDWKRCLEAHGLKSEIPEDGREELVRGIGDDGKRAWVESEIEEALGFAIYKKTRGGRKILEEADRDFLDSFVDASLTRGKCVPKFESMVVKTTQDAGCAAKTNMYLGGHGGYSSKSFAGVIANLALPDFREFLRVLQENYALGILYVGSCYAGGLHHYEPYIDSKHFGFLKTSFPIFHVGTTGSPTTERVSFKLFFPLLTYWQVGLNVSLKNVLRRILFVSTFDLKNLRFLRPAGQAYFLPINTHPEIVELITHVKAMAPVLEWKLPFTPRPKTKAPRPISIDNQKQYLLISPTVVPVPIKFEVGVRPKSLFISPGSSVNFLEGIDLTDEHFTPDKLLDKKFLFYFFVTSFLRPACEVELMAQKIIVVKKVLYRAAEGEEMQELKNVVFIINPISKTLDQFAVKGTFLHGDKQQSVVLVKQKPEWRIRPIMLSRETITNVFKVLVQAIRSSRYIRYRPSRKLFIKPHMRATERVYPALPGQREYKNLILFINALQEVGFWGDRDVFDFLWEQVKPQVDFAGIENSLLKVIEEAEIGRLEISDPDGNTVLHWAARGGYRRIVEILLEKGADINAKNNETLSRETALLIAIKRGYLDLAKLIIKRGADVTVADTFEKTALVYAQEKAQNAPSDERPAWDELIRLIEQRSGTGRQVAVQPVLPKGRFDPFKARPVLVY